MSLDPIPYLGRKETAFSKALLALCLEMLSPGKHWE